MNWIFQIIGLLRSCLVALLIPFVLTKWLTKTFVDCKIFNKGKTNKVHIEWTHKKIKYARIKRTPN